MEVKDKVAIVTGASSGIGEAAARLLATSGAKVVLAARSEKKLNELSKELPGSLVIVTDMTLEQQVRDLIRKTVEHFGRLDILVNNAGQGYDASIEEVDSQKFREVFDLDLLGPVIAMQEAIPHMRKQGSGSIVNISSGTALMALPGMAPYSSMKRALVGFSLTAREEVKGDNINVSVVYPYITKTNFEKNMINSTGEELQPRADLPPFDSAEFVAGKILEVIKSGEAEMYVHDWMKERSK